VKLSICSGGGGRTCNEATKDLHDEKELVLSQSINVNHARGSGACFPGKL